MVLWVYYYLTWGIKISINNFVTILLFSGGKIGMAAAAAPMIAGMMSGKPNQGHGYGQGMPGNPNQGYGQGFGQGHGPSSHHQRYLKIKDKYYNAVGISLKWPSYK